MVRLTREQVRAVDRIAVDKYGVPGVVLMENAAIGAAGVAREMLGEVEGKRVLVLCGAGNNGGDGFAIARHLHNWGAVVQILATELGGKMTEEMRVNVGIVAAMKLTVGIATGAAVREAECDLVVDALLGTGLKSPPRAGVAEVIGAANSLGKPILAVDVPSGLDCDTGRPLGEECVRATRTVTFVAEKVGFGEAGARAYLGEVSVVGIGCPKECVEEAMRLNH